MSNYFIGPDGNLYNTDELMHFKYLKKVKVNGKWRYYYDADQLRKDMQSADLLGLKARRNLQKVHQDQQISSFIALEKQKGYWNAQSEYEKKKKAAEDVARATRTSTDKWIDLGSYKKKVADSRASADKAYKESKKLDAKLAEAQKKYDKTIVGAVEKHVKGGMAFVKRLFGIR